MLITSSYSSGVIEGPDGEKPVALQSLRDPEASKFLTILNIWFPTGNILKLNLFEQSWKTSFRNVFTQKFFCSNVQGMILQHLVKYLKMVIISLE